MNAKHTPGPWMARHPENANKAAVIDRVGALVAVCSRADDDLIAAAPELLAALELAEETLTEAFDGNGARRPKEILKVVRVAIAKAKGAP